MKYFTNIATLDALKAEYRRLVLKMHYRNEIQSYGHPAYNDGY